MESTSEGDFDVDMGGGETPEFHAGTVGTRLVGDQSYEMPDKEDGSRAMGPEYVISSLLFLRSRRRWMHTRIKTHISSTKKPPIAIPVMTPVPRE
jgi:hypothetical protein